MYIFITGEGKGGEWLYKRFLFLNLYLAAWSCSLFKLFYALRVCVFYTNFLSFVIIVTLLSRF